MHPDLSSHLHTDECNILIKKLEECHKNNSFGKFLGACNDFHRDVYKCLMNEREMNRKKNAEEARRRQGLKNDLSD
ncbi:hypothetical protein O3M35_007484 [Rhynocoris fuscipes]|uniref:COX assembly mitochondrial protein n=1 Tax=Rhynocoris fuscipes TaxID=488301 RepID=A0AAW1DC77_9HEMI